MTNKSNCWCSPIRYWYPPPRVSSSFCGSAVSTSTPDHKWTLTCSLTGTVMAAPLTVVLDQPTHGSPAYGSVAAPVHLVLITARREPGMPRLTAVSRRALI